MIAEAAAASTSAPILHHVHPASLTNRMSIARTLCQSCDASIARSADLHRPVSQRTHLVIPHQTVSDIHQHSTPLAYPAWRTVVETTSRPRVSKVGPMCQTFKRSIQQCSDRAEDDRRCLCASDRSDGPSLEAVHACCRGVSII